MESNELLIIEQERDTVLQTVKAVVVTDSESELQAADMLITVRKELKRLGESQKSWTQPLETQKKRIIEEFKRIKQPLVVMEDALNGALGVYRRVQAEIRAKEQEHQRLLAQRRNDAAIAKGKPPAIPVAQTPYIEEQAKTVRTDAGGLTFIDTWEAEIVDVGLIPTFYNDTQIMSPVMSELNRMAKRQKGLNPPPGVVFVPRTDTRAR